MVDIARRNNCILFSDEMYRYTEHEPQLRLPSACELYERAVSLCGLSKYVPLLSGTVLPILWLTAFRWGLPGLRIGWLATKSTQVC